MIVQRIGGRYSRVLYAPTGNDAKVFEAVSALENGRWHTRVCISRTIRRQTLTTYIKDKGKHC